MTFASEAGIGVNTSAATGIAAGDEEANDDWRTSMTELGAVESEVKPKSARAGLTTVVVRVVPLCVVCGVERSPRISITDGAAPPE